MMMTSRWELHASYPSLSTDSNLSLPITPRRQQSKHQQTMQSLAELEFNNLPDLRESRSEKLHTHPFFSDITEDGQIGSQDWSLPKPQRPESTATKKQKGPTKHRRRRSRSLDLFFIYDKDSLPPIPQRSSSRKNVFVQEKSEHELASSNPTAELDLESGPNVKRNHRRTRSRSLDLTLDLDLLNTPRCAKSRGPCQPMPSLMESYASQEGTPTERRNNTSPPKKKGKHRRMRSRSLDLGVQPTVSELQKVLIGQSITNFCNVESRTVNQQPGGLLIVPQPGHMRRVSSLTMDDDMFRHQRAVEAKLTASSPRSVLLKESNAHLEETSRLQQPTLQGNPTEVRGSTNWEAVEKLTQPENVENKQSTLLSPPSSFVKSKYIPPSPLCFSASPSRSGVKWNYTHRKKNRPKLSPFASFALGVNACGYGKSLKQQESKQGLLPPPPPIPSPHTWPMMDRKTSFEHDENVEQNIIISCSSFDPNRDNPDLSRGSGSSRTRVYQPPLPLYLEEPFSAHF